MANYKYNPPKLKHVDMSNLDWTKTNCELARDLNVNEAAIRYHRVKLGIPAITTYQGTETEEWVIRTILPQSRRANINNTQLEYDLIDPVYGKIDVKSAQPQPYNPTQWKINLYKPRHHNSHHCDTYILVCRRRGSPEPLCVFVIPVNELTIGATIAIPVSLKTKYLKYLVWLKGQHLH